MKPFLDSLSSFWNRLFADSGQLSALYDATYAALGQTYLNLLESTLNKSVLDAGVFHKEYWKLVTIKNSEVGPSGDATYPYGVLIDDPVVDAPMLMNSVVSPTRVLERYVDFDFLTVTLGSGTETSHAIMFAENPFRGGTGGGVLDGFGYRRTGETDVSLPGGSEPNSPAEVDGTSFTIPVTSYFGDVHVGVTLRLYQGNGYTDTTIASVVSGYEVVMADSFTADAGVIWELLEPEEVEISLWAAEALLDEETLYQNFGVLTQQRRVSSQAYKDLLQGFFLFYTAGPTLDHIKSVVTVMLSLPVARADGEVLLTYEANVDGIHDRVTTTGGTYTVIKEATREDIKDAASIGTLTFEAFEPFSDVVVTSDYLTDPSWWWNIQIPPALADNEDPTRLVSSPNMYFFVVDAPANTDYPTRVGDLGLYVGAVPSYRHSYATLETYLKYHVYLVGIEAAGLTVPYDDIFTVLYGGSLAGTYPILTAEHAYEETASIAEALVVTQI